MNLSARSCLRFGLGRRLMAGDLRVVGLRIVTMPFDKAMELMLFDVDGPRVGGMEYACCVRQPCIKNLWQGACRIALRCSSRT